VNPELPLRDIHLPPEPSWWPPAPGWWLLALLVAAAAVMLGRTAWRAWRERRRIAALAAEFDAVAVLPDAGARLAGISQLLRRAARGRDPASVELHGSAWLGFLRGAAPGASSFEPAQAQLLAEGLYARSLDPAAVEALVAPARRCFLALVARP